MVFRKSIDEIIKDELASLVETPITNTAPGTIARSLLEIPAASIAEMYDYVDEVSNNSFLSTASGEFLDRLGVLVGIVRNNSSDSNLKYRISTALQSHAKANMTSIILAAESVEGVSEVIISAGTAGAGSFTIYVIGVNPEEVPWSLLSEVQNAISDVVAYGIHFDVLPISYIDVIIELEVTVKQTSANLSTTIINGITQYIQSIRPGQVLATDAIIASVALAVGIQNIVKTNILKLYVNGKRISGNYRAAPNQVFTIDRFSSQPAMINIKQ